VKNDLFALAITFAVITIYDAINIRYEAWLHAWALNKHIWELKFRESLWHLPSEAFAWSIVWILVAVIMFYL
jgi:acid phosphatase family membrane protein YuiD